MSRLLNLLFEPDSYSNEYLLAKFGFDTAENEPLKVCQKLAKVRIEVRKNLGDDVSAGGCTAQSLEDFCLERSVTAGLLEVRKQA